MKRVYIWVILMTMACGIKAQVIQNQEFEQANFYYNESRFDTALVIYERIIDEGYISAPLLYNIGNTYFKLRNYPMAILSYEKALKLEPGNEDIKQNLAIANALITDKIEPLPEFFMKRWWKNLSNKMTANGWAVTSLVMLFIFLTTLFLYLTARTAGLKKSMFFTSLIIIVLLICSVSFASQKYSYLNQHNEAIVMTPTITVKSSPTSSGVDIFVLHEGTKVEILENAGQWDKIKIADGSTGWMPSSASVKY